MIETVTQVLKNLHYPYPRQTCYVFCTAVLIAVFAAGQRAWPYAREEKSELTKRIQELRKQVAETSLQYENAKKTSWESYLKMVKGAGKDMQGKIDVIKANEKAEKFEKETQEKLIALKEELVGTENRHKVLDAEEKLAEERKRNKILWFFKSLFQEQ